MEIILEINTELISAMATIHLTVRIRVVMERISSAAPTTTTITEVVVVVRSVDSVVEDIEPMHWAERLGRASPDGKMYEYGYEQADLEMGFFTSVY